MARSAATTRFASLSKREGEEVKVFLIGDAAACGKEEGPEGPAGVLQHGTHAAKRRPPRGRDRRLRHVHGCTGITDTELTDTTHRSSLEELTNWVQWADRTLVF